MPEISTWAEGWRLLEQVPAGSPCNALTWVKKLDGLDAEEMLCLARNRFPLSQSLLMVCVVEWVIFAITPAAIPAGEARLGPGSCTPHACPAAFACLCVLRRELLACGHRQRLKDVAVYDVWPWTELSCRALWPAAFVLLVLRLSRA